MRCLIQANVPRAEHNAGRSSIRWNEASLLAGASDPFLAEPHE